MVHLVSIEAQLISDQTASVTEKNVAIAVGSMPIVAKFVRAHIMTSTIFQSIRSKLRGSSDKDESYGMTPNEPGGSNNQDPNKPHTWKHPQAEEFYELTDSTFMQTQVTAVDGEDPSVKNPGSMGASRSGINIVRTVSITQQSKLGSKSQLVEQLCNILFKCKIIA
jgi:hypothetical protein